MNKYLLIEFDRYDTHKSKHYHLNAKSPLEAATEHMKAKLGPDAEETGELEEVMEWYAEDLQTVDSVFSCIAGEEEDILIYKL